jgi:hypothetical protein
VAFLGLVFVVLGGIWRRPVMNFDRLKISYPTIFTFMAAFASVLSQRIVNLFNYGFMTVDNYTLSSAVIAYMKRGYWGYQTPPDVPSTLLSVFFSDIFFGWGLLFTTLGIYLFRGRPVTAFFLTALPLTILVETVNDNYFRFAIFLAPLIVVFMAVGLSRLAPRNALLLAVLLSSVSLYERAITTFPTVDYEHRAILDPVDIALFSATVFLAGMLYFSRRSQVPRIILQSLQDRIRSLILGFRRLVANVHLLRSIDSRQIATGLILAMCILLISYDVLAPPKIATTNTTDTDAALVDQRVLPLVQAPSTILMVELIHPNFNFYKDVVVIQMAQPWILETFLRLHLANVSTLLTWLSASKIRYVFVDRGLTAGNEDVFGLFDQLSTSCYTLAQCVPRYDDGRFVLLEIAS